MVQPGWLKFVTYVVLLPLILLQAAGIRMPIRAERAVGVPFGMGIGTLYSVTTISGPPLAVFLNNQGYAKQEFRGAVTLVRVVESTLSATAYFLLGLYTLESTRLLSYIVPSVLAGIPLGTWLIRRMDSETFRRLCMSFDAVIVGFGVSKVLIELGLVPSPAAYAVLAAVVLIDGCLLRRFFNTRAAQPPEEG
ncbi:MAG: sulfite exporter TauE/SafE family protein [Planctomycetes bacterium]|nr:sulfite exporter TauE/SafE family protein [Planctomycetota bacterium]